MTAAFGISPHTRRRLSRQLGRSSPAQQARAKEGRARKLLACALLLACAALLAGCHLLLEYDGHVAAGTAPLDDAGLDPRDLRPTSETMLPPADLSQDLSPLSCSPQGLRADCDPYQPLFCDEGSCYLLKHETGDIAPGCVCPAGGIQANERCQTTTACEPGLVCARISDQGSCRPLCDPNKDGPGCESYQDCVPVIDAPLFGYCAACSEEGRLGNCDPLDNTGCREGDCYLFLNASGSYETRCFCPAGSAAVNEPCALTRECEPGLVCARDSRTCRRLCSIDLDCRPEFVSCFIFSFSFGYCW